MRITPACAGKTCSRHTSRRYRKDHPRVCGENNRNGTMCTPDRGSPPRVRGKLSANTYDAKASRITPACAGKTKQEEYIYGDTEDHPRVCGENLIIGILAAVIKGSPPRVRGKLRDTEQPGTRTRITPACAGKTSTRKAIIFLI